MTPFTTYLLLLGASALTAACFYLLLRIYAWCEGRDW